MHRTQNEAGLTPEEHSVGQYFDELAREDLFAAFDDEESDRVRWFMSQWRVRRGERILEPGCGQGRLTALLAGAVGPEGEVFAVDVSRAMIRQARARALPSQVRFAVRSVYALPQPDSWFDQVVCFNVFPHFLRPRDALAVMARVLKPGGTLWICHVDHRDKLNSFHRGTAAPVARQELPDAPVMSAVLEEAGLTVLQLLDGPETGYLLQARRMC